MCLDVWDAWPVAKRSCWFVTTSASPVPAASTSSAWIRPCRRRGWFFVGLGLGARFSLAGASLPHKSFRGATIYGHVWVTGLKFPNFQNLGLCWSKKWNVQALPVQPSFRYVRICLFPCVRTMTEYYTYVGLQCQNTCQSICKTIVHIIIEIQTIRCVCVPPHVSDQMSVFMPVFLSGQMSDNVRTSFKKRLSVFVPAHINICQYECINVKMRLSHQINFREWSMGHPATSKLSSIVPAQ